MRDVFSFFQDKLEFTQTLSFRTKQWVVDVYLELDTFFIFIMNTPSETHDLFNYYGHIQKHPFM